eukprot:GHVN01079926.1.p1 GENE.GHVN01079926.1~~GHVN01079926.1.p1  ORF type:complete len:343 (-),score=9.31 GHVN01079926.1:607-1605(-)
MQCFVKTLCVGLTFLLILFWNIINTISTISPRSKLIAMSSYITQNGRDGMGHQLLGMYSCMLLPLIDERYVYVKKEELELSGHKRSLTAKLLFDALQDGVTPRPPYVDADDVKGLDSCGHLFSKCHSEENWGKCDSEKRTLSKRWRESFESIASLIPTLGARHEKVILHIRGGDMPGYRQHGFTTIPYLLKLLSETIRVNHLTIVCEMEADQSFTEKNLLPCIKELVPSLEVTFLVGGDPMVTWAMMVRADVLIMGKSSFSVSAALVRTELTFNIGERAPIGGRYDNNALPCAIDIHSHFNMNTTESKFVERYVYYTTSHGAANDVCRLSLV